MNLALRIGELLLSSGAGAADVSAAMRNVAWACGLRGYTADVMFNELTMSQQSAPEQPALIQIRHVRYREVDYGDLTDVDHLMRALVAGHIDRAEATSRLNRIISSGHSRPRWSVTLALGVMGAGVGLVLGGDWLVVTVAAVAAMLVEITRLGETSAGVAATPTVISVASSPPATCW
jgi:uncharacterized membrane protein YjjP (DUF1212 family)